MNAPRRRVMFELKIGADSVKDLIRSLEQLIFDIANGAPPQSVSGSPHSGYNYTYSEDETITHESYHAQLRDYLNNRRETTCEPSPPSPPSA